MKKNMNENITTTQKYEKYYHNAKNIKNVKNIVRGKGGWKYPLAT